MGVLGIVVVVMGPIIMMTMMMTCMSEHILSVISKEIHIMTTKRTASKGEEVTIVIIIIFEQIVEVEKSGVALVSISVAAEVERESLLMLVVSVLMCTERLIESLEKVIHVECEWLSMATSSTLGLI